MSLLRFLGTFQNHSKLLLYDKSLTFQQNCGIFKAKFNIPLNQIIYLNLKKFDLTIDDPSLIVQDDLIEIVLDQNGEKNHDLEIDESGLIRY